MKHPLFDKDDKYTNQANNIETEMFIALQNIFTKYRKNHSVRDLMTVGSAVVLELGLLAILDNDKESSKD